jgi:hypothetical protein
MNFSGIYPFNIYGFVALVYEINKKKRIKLKGKLNKTTR